MLRLLPLLAGLALAVAPAAAQERVCDFSSMGRTEGVEQGGTSLILLHDPFEVRCSDGAILRANSGTLDRLRRELTLVGNVFFEDPGRTLTADHAIYNSGVGRLYATGDVVFTNRTEGSVIEGPELEYFQASAARPLAQVHARQRPHLTLQPREETDGAEPLEIDADRVTIYGQDELHAAGTVVITRTDLRATAVEATYDGASGGLELRGDARIVSREYDLAGEVIQARLEENVLRHVHARTDAVLSGEDLTVTAPDLQLFFADELLQRAVARTPGGTGAGGPAERAVATSRTFRLEADSIDALVPAQRVEQVVAIGDARGESIDTTVAPAVPLDTAAPAPGVAERDWIRGDTITGHFAHADTAGDAPADTAAVLERIVARGSALSLYRFEKRDAPPGSRRGINFLSGEVIELTFAEGEVSLAEVTGLQRGLYLDPAPPPGAQARTSREGGVRPVRREGS